MKNITIWIMMMCTIAVAAYSRNNEYEPDAIYKKLEKEYVLRADGGMDLHVKKELLLNSHYAFNQLFGETFVVYNPNYQELIINESYTIMKDGKRVYTPQNAFNEVLPSSAVRFADYNHLNEMVITHTGLEIGATIILDYTLKTAPEMFQGSLSFVEQINELVPVNEKNITVRVPRNKEVISKITNLRLSPTITEEGDEEVYRWSFNACPGNSSHLIKCKQEEVMLFVQVGALPIGQVNLMGYSIAVPANMVADLSTLEIERKLPIEKVTLLQSYLNERFEFSSLPQEYIGNSVRDLERVYATKITTHAERTLLMVALLNHFDIPAHVVLSYPDHLLPVMSSDRQLLVMVPIEKEIPYIFDVSKAELGNRYFSLRDHIYIDVMSGEKITLKPCSGDHNQAKISSKFLVTKAEMTGNMRFTLQGELNPYASLDNSGKAIKTLVKGGEISKEKVLKQNITTSECEATFTAALVTVSENLYEMQLPTLARSVSSWNLNMPIEHDNSFEIPYPIDIEEEYEILMKGLSCVNKKMEYARNEGDASVLVSLSVKGNKILVKRKITLKKSCYNYGEYAALREMLRNFDHETVRKIYFREK